MASVGARSRRMTRLRCLGKSEGPASEIAIRALFAVLFVVLLRRLSAHFSAKDFLRMHASQNRRHRGSVERNEV